MRLWFLPEDFVNTAPQNNLGGREEDGMEGKGWDGKYAKVSFPFTPQFGGEINSSFEG
jgi:hypothetical protein